MIIQCNKVAHKCSMNTPCEVYGGQSVWSMSHGPEIEHYLPIGVEFPTPFQYDVWELVTWVDNWLKRYYLISGVNSPKAYPIYVNSYHIPDFNEKVRNFEHVPDTTLLLRGMSAWFSYYLSKDVSVVTPQMIYLNDAIAHGVTEWPIRLELFMELSLTVATHCQSYNSLYQIEQIDETLELIDSCIREDMYINGDLWIPDHLWKKMLELVSSPLECVPSDEFDVMLKHAKCVNIHNLTKCIVPTYVAPPIQDILEVASIVTPHNCDNTEFHSVFMPQSIKQQQVASLLTEIADVILIDGYFDFKYVFDFNSSTEIEDYAWCIHGHPGKTRAFKTRLASDINKIKDLDVSKLTLELDRGHLVAKLEDRQGNIHRSTYCLALHMLGPSGIIVLDDHQYFTKTQK